MDSTDSNGNKYLQYNFFLLQGYYKRITINFEVVRTEIIKVHHGNQMNPGSDNWLAAIMNSVEALRYE